MKPIILPSLDENRMRALVKLSSLGDDLYLYVRRSVDSVVLARVNANSDAVTDYTTLEDRQSDLQQRFILFFVMTGVVILTVAMLVGTSIALFLTRPIAKLARAAKSIGEGDFSARVVGDAQSDKDEMSGLIDTFNQMGEKIEAQQSTLLDANRQIDIRRRFTEAVLAGVSAGVIGLDVQGRINLPNRRASELLHINLDESISLMLDQVIPQFDALLAKAKRNTRPIVQTEISMKVGDIGMRTFAVSIIREEQAEEVLGYVVTFDDISDLESAQRKAAWSDVARRIAHEIKNPLTPIQLSAERLKRRYADKVADDPEVFQICTDTIIRQVGDIGRMVDEFSMFAKTPQPEMRPENLVPICQQALFLQKSADSSIDFVADFPKKAVIVNCDPRLVSQAVINVLKNAVEALQSQEAQNLNADTQRIPGKVEIKLSKTKAGARITVSDNGPGIPDELKQRITEPYVTTRTKGTGLGLAITKKIMEDHFGKLDIEDTKGGGTTMILTLPITTLQADTQIAAKTDKLAKSEIDRNQQS